jgi:hypothetical protein
MPLYGKAKNDCDNPFDIKFSGSVGSNLARGCASICQNRKPVVLIHQPIVFHQPVAKKVI